MNVRSKLNAMDQELRKETFEAKEKNVRRCMCNFVFDFDVGARLR